MNFPTLQKQCEHLEAMILGLTPRSASQRMQRVKWLMELAFGQREEEGFVYAARARDLPHMELYIQSPDYKLGYEQACRDLLAFARRRAVLLANTKGSL